MKKVPNVTVSPLKSLNLLSEAEVESFTKSDTELFSLFRHCALAILNTDSEQDNAQEVLDDFADFDVRLLPQP
ncbi:MAG: pyrimidine/purine nucleosidase domain-containing protein, partial [Halioglobus sp.]